jgi:hypothetical protein
MPTLPWTIRDPAPPGTQAHAMASRFEVRSARDVPRFFLKSLVAWRQVRSAPGCVGASLIAQPMDVLLAAQAFHMHGERLGLELRGSFGRHAFILSPHPR